MAGKLQILQLFAIILLLFVSCEKDPLTVRIAVTSDVHGMIFPYDFINRVRSGNSLAHIYKYTLEQEFKEDTVFFLFDNGDFLQGQPTVYYYNFVDTLEEHLSSQVMNFMAYDAASVGNHDIEAGPQVYNRIRKTFRFPWLAANAVDTASGQPYFEPYTILKAGRKKIAVLGLITPGIPGWLPKNLWPGLEFRDMLETAMEWVPRIIEQEEPDLLVGLFHSGTDASYGGNPDPYLNENAVMLVAQQVPGFDIIFAGHDHRVSCETLVNKDGDTVLVIDPGSHGRFAGEATVTFGAEGPYITGRNIPMSEYQPSEEFQEQFDPQFETISTYLEDTITWLAGKMEGRDALFGPSSMLTLIHRVQLDLTGAQLSFTAPLSITAVLQEVPLLVSDMFKLYRFENMLYVMELTGKEIDGFLEHAVGPWFHTMSAPGDPLLNFDPEQAGRLAAPYYNFSSASGINYTVDVTKAPGDRVNIECLSGGQPFNEKDTFRVAINSYRGNGGGGHLTIGAGIPKNELAGRISWSSERDIRFYLMEHLGRQDTLRPVSEENWSGIPVHLTAPASISDRKVLD
ncbi:MAG: 5'-nucleotidase C-terminal domain-containing protein [Bacteroidales bacterium]|nr:5'-nucleotidase C-terminal domain-containing protein [Bacteroidales bacterium]